MPNRGANQGANRGTTPISSANQGGAVAVKSGCHVKQIGVAKQIRVVRNANRGVYREANQGTLKCKSGCISVCKPGHSCCCKIGVYS